jgi:hypothetical protein
MLMRSGEKNRNGASDNSAAIATIFALKDRRRIGQLLEATT